MTRCRTVGKAIGNQFVGRVIGAAVVGGTLSKATGGKFANGAATAAFSAVVQAAATNARACSSPCNGEVSVDTAQLKSPEDYKLAMDHLNSLRGDSSVNQASLGVATFNTAIAGARANFMTISNYDVAHGVFNIRYAQSQQNVVKFGLGVAGVTGVAYGGAALVGRYGLSNVLEWGELGFEVMSAVAGPGDPVNMQDLQDAWGTNEQIRMEKSLKSSNTPRIPTPRSMLLK